MRVWPAPTLSQRLDAAPRSAVMAPLAIALLASAWWGLTPQSVPTADLTAEPRHAGQDADTGIERPTVPERTVIAEAALTASLYDELFPEPPAPEPQAPPPPPPSLDVALIAITREGPDHSGQRAFVRVTSTGEHLSLAAGDRTPGGAVVERIDPAAVTFSVGGREVRAELDP